MSESAAPRLAIIIPTLQRSSLLRQLVANLTTSPQVHEVLVINNAPEPLAYEHPKCRVLDMEQNIFVNPAWNRGVEHTNAEHIGLLNDDVIFDVRILPWISRRLARGAGIIGPASHCVRDVHARPRRVAPRPVFLPTYERPYAFGTAMFMRRSDYTPIPDDLKVWRGDDYLFRRQTRRNLIMLGVDIRTHMSTTSSDAAFDAIKEADMRLFHDTYPDNPYRLRYWKEYRASRELGKIWASARRANRRAEPSHD